MCVLCITFPSHFVIRCIKFNYMLTSFKKLSSYLFLNAIMNWKYFYVLQVVNSLGHYHLHQISPILTQALSRWVIAFKLTMESSSLYRLTNIWYWLYLIFNFLCIYVDTSMWMFFMTIKTSLFYYPLKSLTQNYSFKYNIEQ